MRYFYLGANLRWLLSTTEWPKDQVYQKMVKMYSGAILQAKTAGGVRVADFVPFGQPEQITARDLYSEAKEVTLCKTIHAAFTNLISQFSVVFSESLPSTPVLNTRVNRVPNVIRDSMTFATRQSGLRNSFVLFTDPVHPSDQIRAGQIVDIFLHGRRENDQHLVEPFIVVEEYQALVGADVEYDPYRRIPDLDTRLFYNRFESQQRVVRLQDIQCHFAALVYRPMGIDADCIVARSLDRVRIFILVCAR